MFKFHAALDGTTTADTSVLAACARRLRTRKRSARTADRECAAVLRARPAHSAEALVQLGGIRHGGGRQLARAQALAERAQLQRRARRQPRKRLLRHRARQLRRQLAQAACRPTAKQKVYKNNNI